MRNTLFVVLPSAIMLFEQAVLKGKVVQPRLKTSGLSAQNHRSVRCPGTRGVERSLRLPTARNSLGTP